MLMNRANAFAALLLLASVAGCANIQKTVGTYKEMALSQGYSRAKTKAEKQQSLAEIFSGKNTSSKKTIALVCDVHIRERAAEGVMLRKHSAINAKVADAGSSRQTVSE